MASAGCTLSDCSHEHNKKSFDSKKEKIRSIM